MLLSEDYQSSVIQSKNQLHNFFSATGENVLAIACFWDLRSFVTLFSHYVMSKQQKNYGFKKLYLPLLKMITWKKNSLLEKYLMILHLN